MSDEDAKSWEILAELYRISPEAVRIAVVMSGSIESFRAAIEAALDAAGAGGGN